ncbi:uncharacterized protein LOC111675080 [Lucilia cuprina]|uniref:uncharacterized protein LOC111675080 n=1 Tax=Lucilia cuprina TaxID=7375 RepID=UPI001F069B06|nr:uncharacterized protein LOC111675080 [Lucilia cuprina]
MFYTKSAPVNQNGLTKTINNYIPEGEYKIQNICEKEVIELTPETVNTEFYEYSQESFSDISLNETPTTSTKSKTKKIKLERGKKINSALDKILFNCEEKDTMFSSFGKSVELQLSEMSLISATKAMAEIQLVLSKFMEAESKSNILEKAICNSEIF